MTEKKAALLREDVVKKLVDSHPSRLPPGGLWGKYRLLLCNPWYHSSITKDQKWYDTRIWLGRIPLGVHCKKQGLIKPP